jgi:ASC-1-like (ASCH) protein
VEDEVSGKWTEDMLAEIFDAIRGDVFWKEHLQTAAKDSLSLHLAVLKEPYLQFILRGEKTVESRFSNRRCAPYRKVAKGDVLILKRQSGPILGLCRVSHIWFYTLDVKSWQTIRKEFTAALLAEDPNFWQDRESASFATLMSIENVQSLPPIDCKKRDRRGWVIIRKARDEAVQWNLSGL